ncbi:hypothetical protein D9757_006408 [Collybiopsis confluens]|uniref:Uncharacterized protein n=1 Tax=Collybiopsis confluens TaxID=2823264 RepID=A0A8H5HJM8_9AGAR|nr:hypothetical protein D9757_006408 [Collybiopsis confluens]
MYANVDLARLIFVESGVVGLASLLAVGEAAFFAVAHHLHPESYVKTSTTTTTSPSSKLLCSVYPHKRGSSAPVPRITVRLHTISCSREMYRYNSTLATHRALDQHGDAGDDINAAWILDISRGPLPP